MQEIVSVKLYSRHIFSFNQLKLLLTWKEKNQRKRASVCATHLSPHRNILSNFLFIGFILIGWLFFYWTCSFHLLVETVLINVKWFFVLLILALLFLLFFLNRGCGAYCGSLLMLPCMLSVARARERSWHSCGDSRKISRFAWEG